MSISFEMVGKLSLPKESEKFKNYEEVKYSSGWQNRVLKFNVTAGDNSFLNQIKGGCYEDQHNYINVIGVPTYDEDGTRNKGENFKIPFKERLTSPRLVEVANWKKFVIDLEKPGYRSALSNLIRKIKDEGHEVTDEEAARFGSKELKGLEAALEKSNKKRKEYISEWDFAETVHKVISSDKYKDKKFKVTGTYDMQYSESNGRWYNNYVPQRIYLANDDAEEMAESSLTLYFNHESLDDMSLLDKSEYYVNGYVMVYDSSRKENIPAPYTITIPAAKDDSEIAKKKEQVQVKRFVIDDEDKWMEYGCVVTLLNGAQRTSISFDDLTEEQQDSIIIGETTLEELSRELGGSVYGERVTKQVFLKPGKGFSNGPQDTVYTDEDFVIKPLASENESAFDKADEESDDFDIFDDDDDII